MNSADKPIIEIKGLSKAYKLKSTKRAEDTLSGALANLFNSNGPARQQFWALDDISLDIYPGESVGIIGKNGAGKSTLLKILSRITVPTEGEIRARGRVASLLEVGTGFHPELTGHENILLNGSILGLTKKEILEQYDDIVEFSGVEKFLGTPLKHYSSGMQLRLAFAVAAHLQPEVLIIDEVLAVGDQQFQQKCMGKMNEVSQSGRTIIFVSHNMSALRSLCTRCMLLESGRKVAEGPTEEIIALYLKQESAYGSSRTWPVSGLGDEQFKLLSVHLSDSNNSERMVFLSSESIHFKMTFKTGHSIVRPRITVFVLEQEEDILFLSNSEYRELDLTGNGEQKLTISFPKNVMKSGFYKVALTADIPGEKVIIHKETMLNFEVENDSTTIIHDQSGRGMVSPEIKWELK